MPESKPLARIWFSDDQVLSVAHLHLAQEYFREKLKRHNRSLHGFGIVSGLKVTVAAGKVVVEAGLALDCEGNEIVVGTPQTLTPPASLESVRTAYVSVRYFEQKAGPTPAGETSGTGPLQISTMLESFEIRFDRENCTRGHRHLRARWRACGEAHPLTLAKLRHNSQGWRVDGRYRAPVVK